MSRNAITNDELIQFRNLSIQKKVDSMTLYLLGNNGYKYNMQEVAAAVFGAENYSFTVSLIHRCYNFSGQNGGKYKNGCNFERTHGYRVSRSDIEAFVRSYPNGTYHNGITFEDFLMSRITHSSTPAQSHQSQYNDQSSTYSENNRMNGLSIKQILIMIVLLLVAVVVAGNLLKYVLDDPIRKILGIVIMVLVYKYLIR